MMCRHPSSHTQVAVGLRERFDQLEFVLSQLGASRDEQQVLKRAHANEPDARGRHARNDDKERDNFVAQLLVAAAKTGLKLFSVDWVLNWVSVGAFGV